jgi:3-hydroxyacyl-[acyl-carrier-protein] dehydratase
MRFLLLDRVTSWAPGRHAEAVKNVSLTEDFFDDHFPLRPIMPGSLILEGLAQLSGLLLEETMRARGVDVKALMSRVERAAFRRPVRPGDRLVYHAKVVQTNELGGRASAEARLGDLTAAGCQLLFTYHRIGDPLQERIRGDILAMWLEDARIG